GLDGARASGAVVSGGYGDDEVGVAEKSCIDVAGNRIVGGRGGAPGVVLDERPLADGGRDAGPEVERRGDRSIGEPDVAEIDLRVTGDSDVEVDGGRVRRIGVRGHVGDRARG